MAVWLDYSLVTLVFGVCVVECVESVDVCVDSLEVPLSTWTVLSMHLIWTHFKAR